MVNPAMWVLVQYPTGEYAILSGTSDSWRRSSDIQTVEDEEDGWLVHTMTSKYKLYERNIGMSFYMEHVWNNALRSVRGSKQELPKLLTDSVSIIKAMRNLVKYRSM